MGPLRSKDGVSPVGRNRSDKRFFFSLCANEGEGLMLLRLRI